MEAAIIPLHPIEEQKFLVIIDRGGSLPLYTTTVQAGFPSPATDYAAEAIDLNTYASNHPGSTFLVKVEGDSMIGAYIAPGDLAIVNREIRAASGMVVLAFVDGGYTIKRLEIKKDAAYLVSENPKYKPMKIDSPEGGIIWGVVVGIHRKF
ncbi:LexA family transcriptional regulator [Rufibacter sp. XAAS-G3-1]|uniref:LexA family protein n=1 Tax=Rufibacter sp. XAAS-G3-1 TaxID=2729134 RepID=UPI0015E74F64|nr:translesion error-prone DNA polymerase V autoproteolytic subunit [Rufibacter sp. XAAS-G3-1]